MADSYVCSGATLMCSLGTKPSHLKVLGRSVCLAGMPPMANVMDYKPANLGFFGNCLRTTPIPPPCSPITDKEWANGKTDYSIENSPALRKISTCMCKNGGEITIVDDGQKGESEGIQKKEEKNYCNKESDELVLEDAYWIKNGMKIRFIPYQKTVDLTLVFSFKNDTDEYDKASAIFNLLLEVEGTLVPNKDVKIFGNKIDLDKDKLMDHNMKPILGSTGHQCYQYKLKNFSADLINL